jgi:hypothetical protein
MRNAQDAQNHSAEAGASVSGRISQKNEGMIAFEVKKYR